YYLGFKPNNNYSENNKYFNLAEGLFTNKIPENNNYMNSSLSLIFHKILNNIENNCYPTINILLNPLTRNELLTTLIQYYKMHLPNIEQLNSHKILQEVLSS
ncbi:MAG TPA: hypothetical protein P5250_08255, partial [Bacteroidales bacterium]|nr:hypothetical protein [Bacteroidales bacterium]